MDDFTLTNLELRESDETGEAIAGLSHASMKGMLLLSVLELAARGEPRGAVTVVHDAGDTCSRYRVLATALADAGWAVALPDLRGHGKTEGDRGHSAGLREVWRDLGEIQNHLAYRMPDGPKVLIGQGLGALYALSFALERPGVAAAVVLVAPLHEPRFQAPEAPRGLGKLLRKHSHQELGAGLAVVEYRDPKTGQHLRRRCQDAGRTGDGAFRGQNLQAHASPPTPRPGLH